MPEDFSPISPMINKRQFKICGITRASDAYAAVDAGADYLGFIFVEKSPRNIGIEGFQRLAPELPEIAKVAVAVSPSGDFIGKLKELGFQHFQIHFPVEGDYRQKVAQWRDALAEDEVWLAPKKRPGEPFDSALLPFADGILWDAYSEKVYGGTGHTSDWGSFRELSEKHPDRKWILAGGLSPENLASAASESGSTIFDLNSGLESSPGIKDPDRIAAVREVLAAL